MPDNKKPNVDAWVEIEQKDSHKVKALENASRHFDENDQFSVHTLEAIYGRESSFGKNRGQRGINDPAGDFQLAKKTALRMGLTVTRENDERFDVDQASDAAARYLKTLNHLFSKKTILYKERVTTPIVAINQRKLFTLAAYYAGEGRIAQAQLEAIQAGMDPTKWDQVQEYLEQAGADLDEAQKTIGYVVDVLVYEQEFNEQSSAQDKKQLEPASIKGTSANGHWVTIDGNPVFIED